MKKIYLHLTLILTITSVSFGQVTCGLIAVPEHWYFDGAQAPWGYSMMIDTISQHHNIWEIASPHKTVINNAYSAPNVIITDSVNSYPPNDTSFFIFKQIDLGGYSWPHSAELAGYYFVNSDSLKDYGTIEVSLDKGVTWVNIISDSNYSTLINWWTPKPILTGNSNGWQNFWVSLAGLGSVFPVNDLDTILYKFTFISDSIADSLDGLSYDNFQFCNGAEGIEEKQNNNLISIYPNPTNDLLYLSNQTQPERESVQIFNHLGQLVFEEDNFISRIIFTKELKLSDGLYFLKYSDMKSYAIKKFIVQH